MMNKLSLGLVALFVVVWMFATQCSTMPAVTQEQNPSDGSVITENAPQDQGISQDQGTTGTFACGDKQCKVGQEYCKPYAPGTCSGEPIPAGGCPKYCQPLQCGGPQGICHCTTYQCASLPAGCNDCTCLKEKTGGGSSCLCETKDGGLLLNCPSP